MGPARGRAPGHAQSIQVGENREATGQPSSRFPSLPTDYVIERLLQHFSDDESEELTNQPLAPLPDEPEVVDDDMDVDEGTASVPPNTAPASREVTEPLPTKPESKPATPKPHPLSVSFQPDESPAPLPDPVPETAPDTPTDFVEFLKSEEATFDAEPALDGDLSLDMTQMGPDGEPFETTNDLSQLEPDDALLGGGPLLDQAMEEDPFAGEQPT